MIRGVVVLMAATVAWGQETPLDRLKAEAAKIRGSERKADFDDANAVVAPLRQKFVEWIESRLPQKRRTLAGEWENIGVDLDAELAAAGLKAPASDAMDGPAFGYVEVRTQWFAELPDTLFVVEGMNVPCGVDEAVYAYRWDTQGRHRILEDHPAAKWGFGDAQIELSEPDAQGRRLLLTTRWSVQCQSTWMAMAYNVYRLSAGKAERVLAADHEFWLGNDGPEFVVKPDELLVEFLDSSIDGGIHNRTQIDRYRFTLDGPRRVDPVAFQVQDFVEEWLDRPWSEMAERSDTATAEWRRKLNADFVFADYLGLGSCDGQDGVTLVGLAVRQLGKKELPDPMEAYFRVRNLGDYRYRMEGVTGSLPRGCALTGEASSKHPWLSADELKGLR